jgi:Kelch motif
MSQMNPIPNLLYQRKRPLRVACEFRKQWVTNMKAVVLATLVGVAIHSVNAATLEDTIVLTLNSTRYCVGASWNLNISNAAPNAVIRLKGTSDATAWEIPQWAKTDATGNFSTSGTHTRNVVGKHTLRVEIAASTSNIIQFEVLNCGLRNTGSLSLNTAGGGTATLLGSGKVLVTGLYSAAGVSDSAELYDPVSETWSVTGKLITARVGHTATLLSNGKVLVAGGWAGPPFRSFNSAELYDPVTETWSVTGSLNAVRFSHTATLLNNGQILVTAGVADGDFFGLPTSELYDPGTGTWRKTGSLPYSGHLEQTATLLPNGKVLLVGGINLGEAYPTLGGAALYDPAAEAWRATGAPNTPRAEHTATLLPNGKVLVHGSRGQAELYDPETGTWSPTGFSNTPPYGFTATLLPNGKVLIVSCCWPTGGIYGTIATSSYDPDMGTWSDAVPFDIANPAYLTATLLPSGKVLLAGGQKNSAQLYDGGFEIPLLTLNSTNHCIGASWDLMVTRATPTSTVRLIGTSNGASWGIARWGIIGADGSFRATGTFAGGTEGTHTLSVEISGVRSNAFSFAVSKCKP